MATPMVVIQWRDGDRIREDLFHKTYPNGAVLRFDVQNWGLDGPLTESEAIALLDDWFPDHDPFTAEDFSLDNPPTTPYYIVEVRYTGPNPEQHLNDDYYEISTLPPRNMSHTICTEGWLGTTNNISRHAHGEFETLDEARAALDALTGDNYREPEDWEPYTQLDDDDETIEPAEVRLIGKLVRLSCSETREWAYQSVRDDIHADTTDEQIEALVADYISNANDDGIAPDEDDLRALMVARRDELQTTEDD
jgi:hypothetical protein